MEDKLKACKKEFEKIEIPIELDERIRHEINKDMADTIVKKKDKRNYKKIGLFAAGFAFLFMGTVNISPTIAMAMYQVPILGDIARVVTFREYKFEDEKLELDVKIPKLEGTGNKGLEDRINQEIDKKIQQIIKQGEQESDEYNKALKENEETKGETRQFSVIVDYEKKYADEQVVSFVVHKLITGPSAYPEDYYYNINLETGEDLKLSDVLGKDFKEIANKAIKEQIESRMKADENQIFFGYTQDEIDMGIKGFETVEDNTTFYLNEKGNVVITFAKYEISPGYMGIPEFEIIK